MISKLIIKDIFFEIDMQGNKPREVMFKELQDG